MSRPGSALSEDRAIQRYLTIPRYRRPLAGVQGAFPKTQVERTRVQ